jgi:hypothetical protein
MNSSSLLDSKFLNKLQVNRLEAQYIRSDNISNQEISYLYSVISEYANLENLGNESNSIKLNLVKEYSNITEFSDRPIRISNNNFDFDKFVMLFENLNNNSFEVDPPNCVLVANGIQITYKMELYYSDDNVASFILSLIDNETIKHDSYSGSMNLFVDVVRNHSAAIQRKTDRITYMLSQVKH